MMNLSLKVLCLAAVAVMVEPLPALAAAEREGQPQVWVLSGLERALRHTLPGPNAKAVVRAARNEWESFQIVLRSSTPVRILDVVPGTLRGPAGAALPSDSMRLYREHQLNITRPSGANKDFEPGWYPDALIPFRHPMTSERLKGGRFQAVPFELPANETHAFWADVHIPSNAAAGRYAGEIAVQIEGSAPLTVPVEVEIWEFTLPERPAMYTEFGSPAERMPRYYGSLMKKGVLDKMPDLAAIYEQCSRLTAEHRLNSPPPPDLLAYDMREDGSFELSAQQIADLKRWADRFHLNALPVPAPRRRFRDPDADRDRIHRWLRSWDRAFDAAGLGDLLVYTYLYDEPNSRTAYQIVRRWGRCVRESGSRVKALVVEQTKTQDEAWGDLYGAVDIWVPLFPLFDADTARARQERGEQIWTYTALTQRKPTPWWQTELPLCHYRVPAWIGWRYEMKGLLYWGSLSHWSHVEDTWTDPATYQPGNRSRPISKRTTYNGEGLLVYPARDVGFDGVVPSMRLKALRDGLEDFDYLALLESRGLRGKALEIVMPIGPSWFEWARDPQAYLKAREQLAAVILQGKRQK
ncbi:DUF4091 domain-containing protein [Candidatus Sumerlaeota bacterium]|nr:DUF4091 domain-containing protein [Candidatus Sumerlaeota bacterium]